VSNSWRKTGRICSNGLVAAILFTGGLASPRLVLGQSVPNVGKGNVEVGLFGGESYGLDRFRPMGGANVAYGLSSKLFPFVEASYLPGVLRQATISSNGISATEQGKFNMTDFHGGLHIRLLRPESRVVPYLVAGLGLIHESPGTLPVCATLDNVTECGPGYSVPSSTIFAVNFGGGLRFFFSEHFALRLEFKGFKPTSEPTAVADLSSAAGAQLGAHLFYRFAIGPVFQFR